MLFSRLIRSSLRKYCHIFRNQSSVSVNIPYDLNSFDNPDFVAGMEENIKARKGIGNVRKCCELKTELSREASPEGKLKILNELYWEIRNLPNLSDPITKDYNDRPRVLKRAKRSEKPFKEEEFTTLVKNLKLLRTEALQALTGARGYYFLGALAEFELSLVRYFVNHLLRANFKLISVPDLIPAFTIEDCGMDTKGHRSQVYFLDTPNGGDICLSGTAEMAIAGYLQNKIFRIEDLPAYFVAASRCYRSEVSNLAEERGIYRCHQFTKVEMFAVCHPQNSNEILEKILSEQESQFTALGLDFQVLDMPRHELGAPAYRKFDIEAWFPGSQRFGEISSCSNCTDYQARRLNIRFKDISGDLQFVHTLNGTSCAVPRMIMALVETHQTESGNIIVPFPLQEYFKASEINCQHTLPDFSFKTKSH